MEHQKIQSLWGHVHWLSVLAQQGSYTEAAARLGVSKAAVSQRIAELERAARVALVQRTTRSVRLTEAGQKLVDDTQAAFNHIEQSFAQVRDLAEQPSGLIRVTAPVAFARQQLMPLLTAFLQTHPEVRIELDMADRLRSLATEGFDLAIRHTDRAPDTHVAWTLCESRSVLVATKTYLRRHGTPHTPNDLTQHNCLHYPRAQETPVWSFTPHTKVPKLRPAPRPQKRGYSGLDSDPVISVPVRGALAANNSEALREAALASAGIALLPDFSAQAALRRGQLVVVLPQWQVDGGFGKNIFAIRPYTPHVPRAVSALVAHLRTGLADGFDA